MKVYSVLDLTTRRILYLGPSIDRTARRLEPGCWYGWGETERDAREDAERRKGVRG